MAETLLGNLLGQSSNSTSSGLLGGPSIFQTQPSRGQRRSALLSQAISSQGSNPYARLGAAFGGLIGMGGRAAGESLGVLQEPEQVRQSRLIREAQQAAAESGIDPVAEPDRFLEVIDPIVESDPLLKSGIRSQIIRLQRELATEPQESILRVQGGTNQAQQAAERFPELGLQNLGKNEFATINLTGDRATGIDVQRDKQELPAEFRTLDLQARAAGYSRGSPEYQRFMATGGDVPSPRQPGVPDVENLTVAEEQVDKAYGKEYVEWVQGKASDAQRGAATIANAIKRLESGEENLTGPIIGNAPDQYLATFNKAALDVKQNVEEVVQRNLREILGAQFTQAEGERLISRAYDPKLPAEVNASRLRSLLTQMESAIQSKNDQAAYYQKFGTLKGYEQEIPTKQDFFDALKAEPEEEESERDSKRDINEMNGQELLNLDVNNLNESELNQYNSRIDALMEGNR